jgi:hypothetical protein
MAHVCPNMSSYAVTSAIEQTKYSVFHRVIVRGRVSKYVTNGSKTAAIDVVSFLGVSLGGSTVQLHDSLSSRRACACSGAPFSSQNGDRA